MARAPVPGRCKTRLVQAIGAERAAELYRCMLLDTLERYARLDCARHVLLAAPEDDGVALLQALVPAPWEVVAQRGADLGTRLVNAAATLGPGPLLLAGSDSPTVPIDAITGALEHLSRANSALLGPCDDGGYYLIGLSTPQPHVFEDIPWSTDAVHARTRVRCATLELDVRELPTCFDVDEPADLERLTQLLRTRPDAAPRCANALAVAI